MTPAPGDGIGDMPDARPIFVMGNARSGTTLMRVLLSSHPKIYITHEPWFYVWLGLCPQNMSGDEFLWAYFRTFSFRWLRLNPTDVMRALPSPLPRSSVHLGFRAIMKLKAAAFGRQHWGEKSPGHIDHMTEIFRDFPDAKVIMMVRDPRTTVDSTRRMVWGSQSDLANSLGYVRGLKNATGFRDRVLSVKLEELRQEPERKMRRVLDFVEEPWEVAVLDHVSNNPDPLDMPPVPWLQTATEPLRGVDTRLHAMDPDRVRLIETVCRASMRRYGYEPTELRTVTGSVRTWLRLAAEVPETARHVWRLTRRFQALRNPALWDSPMARYGYLFEGLNPAWWAENEGFVFPTPPELPSPGPVPLRRGEQAEG